MTVPSNLIPTLITSLPVAPVPTSTATMVCVIGGVTYQVPFIDLQSTVSVPANRMINTGGGLQGGGNLSADRTLSIATAGVTTDKLATTGVVAGTYGSGTMIPVVTVNAQGQVTSVTEASLVVSGYVPDTRQIIAGTGLSGGGNLQANRTLNVNFSNNAPLAVGSATSGVSNVASREDHVHPAVDLADATEVTGILPLTQGGTGQQVLSNVNGAIWYNDGTGFAQTVQGNSGQSLLSGGNGAPSWGTVLVIANQPANYIYAGPTSGGSAPTSFRLMVNADVPSMLTGKTMSGALNTFSDIGNGSLTNSSVTYNGVNVALGASGTLTANTTSSLTFNNSGSGDASGIVFNGSTAYTVSYNTIGASPLAGSTSLTTLGTITTGVWNGAAIANNYLANSSITIGTTSTALGASSLTLGGLTSVAVTQDPTQALQLATKQYVDAVGTYTAGTGLTLAGSQFSITNTGVTAASYGTASSVPTIAVNAQGQITSASSTSIAINASAITSGTLPIANGGTNATATPTAGAVSYGTGTAYEFNSVGSTGDFLISGGTGSPTWTSTISGGTY